MTTTLPTQTSHSVALGLLRAIRMRQWVKNFLVLAAPVLSGQVFEGEVIENTAIAFVAFCLASSGIYLVNDVRDLEADRAHPRKRFRPIAAGIVPPTMASTVAAALLVAAFAVGLLADPDLITVLASYVVLQLLY